MTSYNPQSGVWFGTYNQFGKEHNFAIKLVWYNGKITGDGVDEIGTYSIQGSWDVLRGTVEFLKQYHGKHTVNYNGQLSTDSRSISGQYDVTGHSDRFTMYLKGQ